MKKCLLFGIIVMLSGGQALGRSVEFDCESGIVCIGYNDIQIPKSSGTRISFSEDLTTDPFPFVRARLTYNLGKNDYLSVLIAPLSFTAHGSVDREIVFEGVSFEPGTVLEGRYTFNSYRLSYQHSWLLGSNLSVGAGLTAKIRDALISITDDSRISEKTDLGFVPLIKFNVTWRFTPRFAVILDGDALAAPQGRAEDVSLSVRGDISDWIALKAGYRVLEGGSDVEEVYSFTWINYVFAGVTVGL